MIRTYCIPISVNVIVEILKSCKVLVLALSWDSFLVGSNDMCLVLPPVFVELDLERESFGTLCCK